MLFQQLFVPCALAAFCWLLESAPGYWRAWHGLSLVWDSWIAEETQRTTKEANIEKTIDCLHHSSHIKNYFPCWRHIDKDFPTCLKLGPGACWIWEKKHLNYQNWKKMMQFKLHCNVRRKWHSILKLYRNKLEMCQYDTYAAYPGHFMIQSKLQMWRAMFQLRLGVCLI